MSLFLTLFIGILYIFSSFRISSFKKKKKQFCFLFSLRIVKLLDLTEGPQPHFLEVGADHLGLLSPVEVPFPCRARLQAGRPAAPPPSPPLGG